MHMVCSGKQAEAFKGKAASFGSVLGLENMKRLMEELGNIQEKLSVLHVAGTNGKGSVCAMLESVLLKGGYRVGRYSSPAVFCEEEKYKVNGKAISKDELDEMFCELEEACGRLFDKGFAHPTLFELETAAAFLWFYRKNCELVLLETGLGGRLDATNIIRNPLCCVITSVSMDHMAFLGDTLEKIAGEKAGIIKEGCPVVTARQQPEVYKALTGACKKKHAKLYGGFEQPVGAPCRGQEAGAAGLQREAANIRYENGYLCFDGAGYKDIRLSLLGMYQVDNCMCVLRTLEVLAESGFPVEKSAIREGLQTTVWPGRFEILSRNPFLVIDGAHNEDAAKRLRQTLEMGFTNRRIIYIIGVLADKEHEKMLKILLPLAELAYTVTPDNPRALSGEELCREAARLHTQVVCAKSVRQALELAFQEAFMLAEEQRKVDAPVLAEEQRKADAPVLAEGQSEGDSPVIVAFGSLSYLGELKREFQRMQACD